MLVILTSCNSDEPEVNDGVGQLIVNLANNDSENPNMDFSNYHIALTPEYGMGWSAPNFSEGIYIQSYTDRFGRAKIVKKSEIYGLALIVHWYDILL